MEIDKIFKKLQLHRAKKGLIINPPAEFLPVLTDFSFDLEPIEERYDYIHIFATERTDLEQHAGQFASLLTHDGFFWLSYPKGSGNIKTNIKRDTTTQAFVLAKLRPVTQVSIDANWSAIRGRHDDLVKKKTDRWERLSS